MGAGAVLLKISEAVLKRWLEKPDRLSVEGEKIRSELRTEIDRKEKQISALQAQVSQVTTEKTDLLRKIGELTVKAIGYESELATARAKSTRDDELIAARNSRISELETALRAVTRERDRLIRRVVEDESVSSISTDTMPAVKPPK
jgi:predicted RNase H-like nuclease (RuvC/YqgF family)